MTYTKDNPKLVKYFHLFKGIKCFTGVVKDKNNTIAYYLNGKLHRENAPAVTYIIGTKKWYLNGKYHREDGPAIEWADSYKEWWLNDEIYGENGNFTNESWIRFCKLELLK